MKRDTFEAEGRTFCYIWMLCLGFKVPCAIHCYPVLRPYSLNAQLSRTRGSTVLFLEVEKQEQSGSDFFQHRNRCKAVRLGLRFNSYLDLHFQFLILSPAED